MEDLTKVTQEPRFSKQRYSSAQKVGHAILSMHALGGDHVGHLAVVLG